MFKLKKWFILAAFALACGYIKYLQIEIEIARFDCRMKTMKENQRQCEEAKDEVGEYEGIR